MQRLFAVAVAALAFAPAAAPSAAHAAPLGFDRFVAGLATAEAPAGAVSASFSEARSYLQHYYAGMHVTHTAEDQDGRVLDCVRYDEQPALRFRNEAAPAAAPPFAPPGGKVDWATAPRQHSWCAAGTFPIQRITLERVMRAGSLRAFFRKAPASVALRDPADVTAPNYGGHAYAFAYQLIANHGGQTTESLYSPKIDGRTGEIFSLEQQWYIADTPTQTAEVGWQVYPGLYATRKAVLFAYYTADGYRKTGCYNYDCGAFVQLPGAPVTLAAPFEQYSHAGGRQVGITIGYTMYDNRWYLSFGDRWVGYYPVEVYNGGQMSRHAQLFELGTETVGSTVWPAAASGEFGTAGYPKAGYQFNVLLYNADYKYLTPDLTAVDPSPTCFNTTTPGPYPGRGYGFLLGGPGGPGC